MSPLNGPTFTEKLLATIRAVIHHYWLCPECKCSISPQGYGHGNSGVFYGEPCHLAQLLDEAEDAGI